MEYYYNHVIKQDFLSKYSYENVYQLPKMNKIVISMSLSQSSLKSLLPLISALTILSTQKPFILSSNRVYLTLRVKSGVPVGCKVDLRGKRMFFFLEKLIFSVLPRLKEFSVNFRKNVVSLYLFNLFVFKEIEKDYEYFPNLPKMNIHFVISASNSREVYDLLLGFRFPISKLKKL